ncbi:MAG: DUF116 domain-containing protein [Gemmatimonadales bacterium]
MKAARSGTLPIADPSPAVAPPPATPAAPKAELIHLDVDRRLGHEWDEWDGKPLPNRGDFSAAPGLFFRFAALTLAVGSAVVSGVIFLLAPRLAAIHPVMVPSLHAITAAAVGAAVIWYGLLIGSYYLRRPLLPERLLERGPFLQLMNATSHLASLFHRMDWVEHAAIDVYNDLAELRRRRVGKGELLVLIPRCLSKQSLDGVLTVAGRYGVPVFVATRGQLARRVIRERRPRAVVAVACERDMMTGLRDVAGKLPVLGLTMRLPSGPCKDAVIDLEQLERWVKGLTG